MTQRYLRAKPRLRITPYRGWFYRRNRYRSESSYVFLFYRMTGSGRKKRDVRRDLFDHCAADQMGDEAAIEFDQTLVMTRRDFELWIDCGRPTAHVFDREYIERGDLLRMRAVLEQFGADGDTPETCAMLWRFHKGKS